MQPSGDPLPLLSLQPLMLAPWLRSHSLVQLKGGLLRILLLH
jgi:hypothetical protein